MGKASETPKTQINLYIDLDLATRLRERAIGEDRSISAVASRAFRAYLEPRAVRVNGDLTPLEAAEAIAVVEEDLGRVET